MVQSPCQMRRWGKFVSIILFIFLIYFVPKSEFVVSVNVGGVTSDQILKFETARNLFVLKLTLGGASSYLSDRISFKLGTVVCRTVPHCGCH